MGNRPKMDKSERAKQFMPFDAVKGLREALLQKEQELEKNPDRMYKHINVKKD